MFLLEAVPKCFPLAAGFEVKKGENFNHRNMLDISRTKI
jgi:hypothetical protein